MISYTNLTRVREEELLYVLRHLVTMTLWPGTIPGSDQSPLATALVTSPRAHLFRYYPLLLELSFVPRAPSMWILPSEHAQLFGKAGSREEAEHEEEAAPVDVRDGSDLIEITARDLARRALELVGAELVLGPTSQPANGQSISSSPVSP